MGGDGIDGLLRDRLLIMVIDRSAIGRTSTELPEHTQQLPGHGCGSLMT